MEDAWYMKRCFELARLGGGNVLPNPRVGAVLIANGRIIGEGYHENYGRAHAEVHAVAAVKPEDRPLIPQSTLYVSLEPCSIFGKTPPCTDLIIRERIPRVVIAAIDRSPGVDGHGAALLRNAGVDVRVGLLEEEGALLALPRNTFVSRQRPYILLKYALDPQGMMAAATGGQTWISNPFSRRLVHKWRSEAAAILVGTNTALQDDPALTTRYAFGRNPVRIVIDRRLQLPTSLQLFDGSTPTLVYTCNPETPDLPNTQFCVVPEGSSLLNYMLQDLYTKKISSLMVEGGPTLLTAMIQDGLWDEARVITGQQSIKLGLPGPVLHAEPCQTLSVGSDILRIYRQESPVLLNLY